MSDRRLVVDLMTGAGTHNVRLFMDGETGTWRLFIDGDDIALGSVDFSLSGLRAFHAELTKVLADTAADPESFDAEVRATWDDDALM